MKVVLSDEALADLESIGDYIARDTPGRARSFVQELIATANQLADDLMLIRKSLDMPDRVFAGAFTATI